MKTGWVRIASSVRVFAPRTLEAMRTQPVSRGVVHVVGDALKEWK
jgi:hypothetical protein